MPRQTSRLRSLTVAAVAMGLITSITLVLFDVAAYWLLPHKYTLQFAKYRAVPTQVTGGRGGYPYDYFVAHEERGFDIGANKKARHSVESLEYPIWSNSLGCFDEEPVVGAPYTYLVGDSYTWGYATFEDKFGTLVASETGAQVLKCGVTHTGQRHQLLKLQEIAAKLGRPPGAMLVFWYHNDVANDFSFPHSTVVDGWQVDQVFLGPDDQKIRVERELLQEQVREQLARLAKKKPRKRDALLRYSLTANLVSWAFESLSSEVVRTAGGKPPERRSIYDIPIEKDGHFWYADNPQAAANKTALLDLAGYAAANGSKYAVILIPPREHTTDSAWHQDVHAFLEAHQIRYLDLADPFAERDYAADDVFWLDGHFNAYGNRVLADILESEFAEFFVEPSDQ